ncbi:hypothetical protein ABBQ38_003268 [Trebouxia sp. C0009 RCD-2024]
MAPKPTTNLALESGAAEDASVVDALPYIDGITADERYQADELIKEELKRSNKKPSDYLAKFAPMPPTTFQGHPVLQHEYDRVKAGRPVQPLDTSRFHLEPPPASKQNDFNAWRQATDNAHSQLEHQYNRLLNLELLLRYGSNARRRHNQSLEGHVHRLEGNIEKLSQQRDSINKQRKLTQEADGRTLKQLEQQYKALVTKNMEIHMACQELESSVNQLQEEVGHRDDSSQDMPYTQIMDLDAPEPAPKDPAADEVEVEL